MSDQTLDERIDATELPEAVIPGHHAMTTSVFSWGDDSDEVELPAGIIPGHHAMARAVFSWGD
jgi:hypothetical protein